MAGCLQVPKQGAGKGARQAPPHRLSFPDISPALTVVPRPHHQVIMGSKSAGGGASGAAGHAGQTHGGHTHPQWGAAGLLSTDEDGSGMHGAPALLMDDDIDDEEGGLETGLGALHGDGSRGGVDKEGHGKIMLGRHLAHHT